MCVRVHARVPAYLSVCASVCVRACKRSSARECPTPNELTCGIHIPNYVVVCSCNSTCVGLYAQAPSPVRNCSSMDEHARICARTAHVHT